MMLNIHHAIISFITTATLVLIGSSTVASGLSSSSSSTSKINEIRSIVVTGANKGQGYALCERILSEHDDTHVFLCSRSESRGQEASERLSSKFGGDRVDFVQLDVTDPASVSSACSQVKEKLEQNDSKLYGLVSNAGILWGYKLSELCDVCATGVQRVLDGFLPHMNPSTGRVIVVSSGLGPLMHGFSRPDRQELLIGGSSWDILSGMMEECIELERVGKSENPVEFGNIGFPGGPFEEAVPEFHMYGLSKMFADAYMLTLAKANPNLFIASADPGLVYTDLIGRMPRYEGKSQEESGAKTPAEGVEVNMRLLFGERKESGKFYAMNKDRTDVVFGDIDKRPDL